MGLIARPLCQPASDEGGLVSAVVVQDEMHVEVCGDGSIDGAEEFAELAPAPVGDVALVLQLSRLATDQ